MKKFLFLLTSLLILLTSTETTFAAGNTGIANLGVIEGFYGHPWSQEDRIQILNFMGKKKMNLYIYAPKDDPYHREKWREAYPPREMQQLKTLIDTAQKNQVTFVFALSPGLDLHFTGPEGEKDFQALYAKFTALQHMGVRQFAIFFDDIKNKDGVGQAEFINRINRAFIHKNPGLRPLFTVPTEYYTKNMFTDQGIKTYTRDFARHLDRDIEVLYTGPGVVCENIPLENIEQVEKIYQRKPAIWWNYPVSDYRPGKLALGPLVGMDPGIEEHTAALLLNPMEHAALSEITLATAADYAKDPKNYQPEKAWEKALQEQYGPLAEDMQRFADHSQRMEAHVWAYTGREDAPMLRQQMDTLWQGIKEGKVDKAAVQAIEDNITRTQRSLQKLERSLPPRIKEESQPQRLLLTQLLTADQTALHLIEAATEGNNLRAKVYRQQLVSQIKALPTEKQAAISEKTAAAFLQETLQWFDQQNKK